jgi:predicted  nucleic acid-binding Zn-ribbon protein
MRTTAIQHQNQSLEQIEEELARTERKLASLRATLKRSHQQSSADATALRDMGARAKEIMNRPKTWRGGSKRSDATELEALRAEMRARSEATSRTVEDMKSMSAEATELSKLQQDLSRLRAELVARGETRGR